MSKKSKSTTTKNICCNISVLACIGGMIGVAFAPTIMMTVTVTAIGGGIALVGIAIMSALNVEEKK